MADENSEKASRRADAADARATAADLRATGADARASGADIRATGADNRASESDRRATQSAAQEFVRDFRTEEVEKRIDAIEADKIKADEEVIKAIEPVREDLKRWQKQVRKAGVIVICMFLFFGYLGYANRKTLTLIGECTTAGPARPTVENNYTTGHACFDAGTRRGVAFVNNIADSNKNNIKDVDELRALIEQNGRDIHELTAQLQKRKVP